MASAAVTRVKVAGDPAGTLVWASLGAHLLVLAVCFFSDVLCFLQLKLLKFHPFLILHCTVLNHFHAPVEEIHGQGDN